MDGKQQIFWQAHRGGGGLDMPDNTLAAVKYGWSLGAIPEVDIRLTADSQLVCLHDDILARTTDAPPELANTPVRQLPAAVVRRYDAGVKFAPQWRGEKVPLLAEVFELMKEDPARLIYADIKDVESENFGQLVGKHGVAEQIIVCSCDPAINRSLKAMAEGLRAMQWIGGAPEQIRRAFAAATARGFEGLFQVQLHLGGLPGDYELPLDFLADALAATAKHGVSLQVFPFRFDQKSLFQLLDLGLRWFVTDEPRRFSQILNTWREKC